MNEGMLVYYLYKTFQIKVENGILSMEIIQAKYKIIMRAFI